MSWRVCILALLLLVSSAAAAQERQLVATLHFEVGEAALDDGHRAQLDALRQPYPPADYMYTFEGDHDPSPFEIVTPNASTRINERLAETRWQAAAQYLGVPAWGLVRYTGSTEARVFVQPWSAVRGMGSGGAGPGALQDSLARLDRELRDLQDRLARSESLAVLKPAVPETVFAVATLERIHERSDKWVDRRWWESQGGFEVGLLRVQPPRPGRPSGATLQCSNGTPAYHALDISTRLDFARLGNDRLSVTPALRWYDWSIRVHYGDDPHTAISFVNLADPIYVLGGDLDAAPWPGGALRLKYVGFGARVHGTTRKLVSFDQFDLRLAQRLWPKWGVEAQAVYDERFEIALSYYGAWLARAWRMRIGEFSMRLGFVEQHAAFAAVRRGREDPISTISLGFAWDRERWLTEPRAGR